MSSPSTPRANASGLPKQMSSRLLTMKFMQRAASTNTRPNANRTLSASQPTTPASEPASKRQKTDHTPDSSVPTTPATEPHVYASRSDIKAAIQAESAFEALARAKRAELGFGHNEYETEWVLNVPVSESNPSQVAVNGDHESDSGEEEDTITGRQTYGGFKRQKKTTTTTSTPGSKSNMPAQNYKFDNFESDSNEADSEDGELDSDEEEGRSTSRAGSGKKRKRNPRDEDDEVAMSALDRVDLSKTGYAKAKGATSTSKNRIEHGSGKFKKGKQQGKGQGGKKKGRKK